MSNPLFSSSWNRQNTTSTNFSSQNQQTTSLLNLYKQVRNSSNPNQMMQNLLANNSDFQQIMNYIRDNGGDAKTAFYNMAAQKGVDPNSIINSLM